MWYLGPQDYFVNTQGQLETTHLLHQQSCEDADLFIELFKSAIDQGYDPNNADVQEEVFRHGNLGGFTYLMGFDQERVLREIERYYKKI